MSVASGSASPQLGVAMAAARGKHAALEAMVQEQAACNEQLDAHMDALASFGARWRSQAADTMWRTDTCTWWVHASTGRCVLCVRVSA